MGWLAIWLLLSLLAGGRALRLPGDVIPHHYDVRLLYDIDTATNFSFYGVVDISLTVTKPTSEVVLHAQNLTIPEDNLAYSSVLLDTTDHLLTLKLKQQIENANYTLIIIEPPF